MSIRFLSGVNVDSNTLFVDSTNDRVGIGTASPGVKLQVDGTIWAKPTSNGTLGTALRLGVFTDSASTAAYEFKTNDSTDDFLGLYSNRWGINYEIHRDSATGDKYVWSVYGDDSGHIMQLYNGSNTNSVRLSSFSSSWLNGGNVGIGTTSPGSKLQVEGTNPFIRVNNTSADDHGIKISYNGSDAHGLHLLYNANSAVSYIDNTYQAVSGQVYGDIYIRQNVGGTMTPRITIKADGGNVGIGTTTPGRKLTVQGADDGTMQLRLMGTASQTSYWEIGREAQSTGQFRFIASRNGTVITPMVIDDQTGNVGIGTTNPAYKLDVNGTFHSGGDATFNGTNVYINSSYIYVGNNTADLVSISGNTMYFPGDGNVGIGTTSPQGKLHVTGLKSILSNYGVGSTQIFTYQVTTPTSSSTNQTFDLYLGRFGNGYHKVVLWGSGYGTDVGNYFDITRSWGTSSAPKIISSGGLYLGGATYTIHWASVSNGQYDLFIKWTANMPAGYDNTINYSIQSNTGSGYTQFDYPGGVTVPTLDSSNLVQSVITFKYNDGNVGVGTTSPDAIFHVAKATSSGIGGQIVIDNPSSSAVGNSVEISFLTDAGASGSGTRNARIIAENENAGNGAANMQFHTWSGAVSAERMRITSGGNVGIGTTSPTSRLTLVPPTVVDQSTIEFTSTDNAVISSYYSLTLAVNNSNTQSGRTINFSTGGKGYGNQVSTMMVIQADSGNVGIGTTSPFGRLNISRNGINEGTISFDDQASNAHLVLAGADSLVRMQLGTYNNGSYGAWIQASYDNGGINYGTEPLILNPQGNNVGIGTTSPSNRLTVYQGGGVRVTGITSGDWIEMSGNLPGYTDNQYPVIKSNGTIHFANNNKYSAYLEGANTYFGILDSTTTTRVFLTTSGNSYLTGGNVGIGTTSPSAKLHILGSGLMATIQNSSAGTDEYSQLEFAAGNRRGYIWLGNENTSAWAGAGGLNIYTSNGNMDFWTSGSQKVRIDTSGNVGIGTTSPSYKLHVNGAFGTNPGAYISGDTYGILGVSKGISNASAGVNYYQGSTQKWFTGVYENSDNYGFYSVGTAGFPMVIQYSTGNVGIGTTSPTQLLHITGTNAANNGVTIQNTNASGNSQVRFLNTSGTERAAITYVNSADAVYFYLATAGNILNLVGGNVGIGTTSPASPLQISAASVLSQGVLSVVNTYASGGVYYPAARFVNQRGDHSFGIISEFYTGATSGSDRPSILFNTGNSSNSWQVGMVTSGWGGNDSFGIGYRANNDPASFNAWPTARFLITTDGNVGIGTTSPASVSNYIAQTINGTDGSFTEYRQNGTALFRIGADISRPFLYGMTNAPMDFYTNTNLWMRITSAGNVGIGTTAPGSKLHVWNGGVQVTGFPSSGNPFTFLQSDYNDAAVTVRFLNVNPSNGLDADLGIQLSNTSNVMTDVMRIKGSTGNVGIGTTSPSEKLHVDGNVIVTYNNSYQGINSIGNKAILARVSPTTGIINYAEYATAANLNGFVLGSDDARVKGDIATDSLDFITNTSSRMFINSSGNVGIGTTSPSYKLDVVGDSRVTSGSLGVGVAPNATDGRIDASNDIVAYSTSDQRLKENVTPIENALEKVKTLIGVEFDWKEETAHVHGYHGHDVGIIAQDVQAVLPEAVRTNDSGYLSVRYEKMIALLIEANKELAARVELLEQKLKQ